MTNGAPPPGMQSATVGGVTYTTDGNMSLVDGRVAISEAASITVTQQDGTTMRAFSRDESQRTMSLTYVPFLNQDILMGCDRGSIQHPDRSVTHLAPGGRVIDLVGKSISPALAAAISGQHIDGIAYTSDGRITDGPNGAEIHDAATLGAIIMATGERLQASSKDGEHSMSLRGNIIVQSGTVTIRQIGGHPVHLEPERGRVNLNERAPQFAR